MYSQLIKSSNGWGATIIDGLDTMIIMGLKDEYNEALDYIKNDLHFNTSIGNAKGFETSIRYLGGLISAYDLAGDPILLDKAKEVMKDTLLPLFSSPSGAPYTYMDVNRYVHEESRCKVIEQVLNARFLSHIMQIAKHLKRPTRSILQNLALTRLNSLVYHKSPKTTHTPNLPINWLKMPLAILVLCRDCIRLIGISAATQ